MTMTALQAFMQEVSETFDIPMDELREDYKAGADACIDYWRMRLEDEYAFRRSCAA